MLSNPGQGEETEGVFLVTLCLSKQRQKQPVRRLYHRQHWDERLDSGGDAGEKNFRERENHFGPQRNLAREKACAVIKKGKNHKSPFKSAEQPSGQ